MDEAAPQAAVTAAESGEDGTAATQVPSVPRPELWCSRCGQPVLLTAGAAVHAVTLSRTGAPDDHEADPVSEEPRRWKEAREIEADLCGVFTVGAGFGFLWAEWSPEVTPPEGAVKYFEAGTEKQLRRLLTAALAGTLLRAPVERAGTGHTTAEECR